MRSEIPEKKRPTKQGSLDNKIRKHNLNTKEVSSLNQEKNTQNSVTTSKTLEQTVYSTDWKNTFYKKGSFDYWVCTYPMFTSTLYLSNVNSVVATSDLAECREEVKNIKATLTFYDPDGSIFNTAEIEVPNNEITAINLNPFMGSAKLQAGLKHGRLKISGSKNIISCLRLYATETQEVLEPLRSISIDKPDFFKLTFAVDRLSYLALINPASKENTVKLRVFSALEELEEKLVIPPRGSRVYEIASLFPKIISKREERSFPAYIRLITRASESLGVQCYQQRLITPLT